MTSMKQHSERLAQEFQSLTSSEAPVVLLERENMILKQDREKFGQYLEHLGAKRGKLEVSVSAMREELEEQGGFICVFTSTK
jgi:hypothetical protein